MCREEEDYSPVYPHDATRPSCWTIVQGGRLKGERGDGAHLITADTPLDLQKQSFLFSLVFVFSLACRLIWRLVLGRLIQNIDGIDLKLVSD